MFAVLASPEGTRPSGGALIKSSVSSPWPRMDSRLNDWFEVKEISPKELSSLKFNDGG